MSRRVVVNGAAGALGGAVITEMLARDWAVVALDRPGQRLRELAATVPSPRLMTFGVDLADRSAVRDAWSQVDKIGDVRAVVNLVGGYASGSLAETDENQIAAMTHVNLAAALWACQAALPRLADQGFGAVVNVGSRSAFAGTDAIAYSVAKSALVRATALLAEQHRQTGVRINMVHPSVLDTPANRAVMPAALIAAAVPPAAVAKVIAFLCEDDSWPINGANVPVYGQA